MRRLFYTIVWLLVFVVGTAIIAPSFIDWNIYRQEIAEQIESLSGRSVSIDGDIAFTLLPSPALSVENLRVANLPGAKTVDFIVLQSLDIEIAALPLLRGIVQMERTVLKAPTINLERLQNGDTNWVFANTTDESASNAEKNDLFRVTLDRLVIEQGTIRYFDATNNTTQVVEDIEAVISARTIQGPASLKGTISLNTIPLALDISVGDLGKKRFPIDIEVRISDTGTLLHIAGVGYSAGVETVIDGNFDLEVANSADLLKQLLGTDTVPAWLDKPMNATGKVLRNIEGLLFEDMTITVAGVSVDGEMGVVFSEIPSVKLQLSLPNINLDDYLIAEDDAVDADSEVATFSIPTGIDVDVDLRIDVVKFAGGLIRQVHGSASLSEGKISLTSFRALLPGGSDVMMSGVLSEQESGLAFDGKLKAGSSNMRALASWLSADVSGVPVDRLGQLALSTSMRLTNQEASFYEIEGQIDTSSFTGSWSQELSGERPSTSIDLSIDRLNLDAYGFGPSDAAGGDFSVSDLDLAFNLGGKLSIGRLVFAGQAALGLVTEFTLNNGKGNIRKLVIDDLAGARIKANDAQFVLGEAWELAGQINVETDNIARFLTYLDIRDLLFDGAPNSAAVNTTIEADTHRVSVDLTGFWGASEILAKINAENWQTTERILNIQLDVRSPDWASLASMMGSNQAETVVPAISSLSGTIVGRGQAYQINVGVRVGDARIGIIGAVDNTGSSPTVSLETNLSTPSMWRTLAELGWVSGPGNLNTVALKMDASIASQGSRYSVSNLEVEMDDIGIVGEGSIDFSTDVPMIEGTLQMGAVDIGSVMNSVRGQSDIAVDPGQWSDERLNFDWLSGLSADISVHAENITYGRFKYDSPAMKLVLSQSRLDISGMNGGLFGGELQLNATIAQHQRGSSLALDLQLKDALIASALKTAAGVQLATGVLQFEGSFTTSGHSQKEFIKNLQGRGAVHAANGVVRGIDLPRLSAQLLELIEYEDFIKLTKAILDGGETRYTSFSAPFTVNEGVVIAANSTLRLEGADGKVDTKIDLPQWRLDSEMVFQLNAPEHKDTPAVGLHVYGPINDPRKKNRVEAMGAYVAARLASRVLQDIAANGGSSGLRQLLGGAPVDESAVEGETAPTKSSPMEAIFRGILGQIRRGRQ